MLELHADGCIVSNMRTRNYRVSLRQTCPHTKIVSAEITVSAESAESAMFYVNKYLRIPQTAVISAVEVTE